jgi:hypothetical protein
MDGIDIKETFGLTEKESEKLVDIFKNKKNSKVSITDRQNIINKLMNSNKEEPKETKNIKDMNEKEKKEYLQNLKNKLHNKKKIMETSRKTKNSKQLNVDNQEKTLSKTINDLMIQEEKKQKEEQKEEIEKKEEKKTDTEIDVFENYLI